MFQTTNQSLVYCQFLVIMSMFLVGKSYFISYDTSPITLLVCLYPAVVKHSKCTCSMPKKNTFFCD